MTATITNTPAQAVALQLIDEITSCNRHQTDLLSGDIDMKWVAAQRASYLEWEDMDDEFSEIAAAFRAASDRRILHWLRTWGAR